MKTMKNNFMLFLAVMILSAFVLNSCSFLQRAPILQPGTYLTTSDNISDSFTGDLAVVPRSVMPKDMQKAVPGTGDLVVATKDIMKDPVKSWTLPTSPTDIAADPEAQTDFFWGLWDVAKSFVPGMAAWEILLALFIPQKRAHYVAAASAANPLDGGSVDIKGAIVNLAKALSIAPVSESEKTDATVVEPPVSTPPTPSA